MKKNILKATLVAAFALIAGMNVYNAQKSLADGGEWGSTTCYWIGDYYSCPPWGTGVACICWN